MADEVYFSHDADARNDLKILAMRNDFGLKGYGLFWAIIEFMRMETGYRLKQEDCTWKGIAKQMDCKPELVEDFVMKSIKEYHLFESDDEYFWSESLLRRMEKRDEIKKKRQDAARKRWDTQELDQEESKSSAKAMQNDAKKRKGKERKGKERKGKERKEKKDSPEDKSSGKLRKTWRDYTEEELATKSRTFRCVILWECHYFQAMGFDFIGRRQASAMFKQRLVAGWELEKWIPLYFETQDEFVKKISLESFDSWVKRQKTKEAKAAG